MPLNAHAAKSVIAATCNLAATKKLFGLVSNKTNSDLVYIIKSKEDQGWTRAFWFVMKNGFGKKTQATNHALNWLGNVSATYAGTGVPFSVGDVASLGAGINTMGGKGGGLKGLSGGSGFQEGVALSLKANPKQIKDNLSIVKGAGLLSACGYLDYQTNKTSENLRFNTFNNQMEYNFFLKLIDQAKFEHEIAGQVTGMLIDGRNSIMWDQKSWPLTKVKYH